MGCLRMLDGFPGDDLLWRRARGPRARFESDPRSGADVEIDAVGVGQHDRLNVGGHEADARPADAVDRADAGQSVAKAVRLGGAANRPPPSQGISASSPY